MDSFVINYDLMKREMLPYTFLLSDSKGALRYVRFRPSLLFTGCSGQSTLLHFFNFCTVKLTKLPDFEQNSARPIQPLWGDFFYTGQQHLWGSPPKFQNKKNLEPFSPLFLTQKCQFQDSRF
jgi:hypothetical protein